ncbi:MAG TPA: hypothetical protein IAA13_00030 [Candidatus Alistipes merdigallinarum]|nr:hypothetical protein [Candidatus Alistipes merdigallinarum]
MKDIVITKRHIRREVVVWIICLILITIWNIIGIIKFDTQWIELISLWYVVIPLSILLYIILIPFRWIGCLVIRKIKSRPRQAPKTQK